ncbi:MAG: hypothetical protein PHS04_17765 [Tissierellia bacterium]|nr:hypothetical protein [Tissierellia bacterium]
MQKWCRSENYIGESYNDYYVLLSRSRDSGLVEESNFQSALKALNGESKTVKVIRSSHWLCGWIEMILIHESDKVSVDKGFEIEKALDNYPILDDIDFSERESEKRDEYIEEIRKAIANECGDRWDLTNNATDEEIYDMAERYVSDDW